MKLSIMSTFNVPCGIATYTSFLCEGLIANLYSDFDILAEKVEVLNLNNGQRIETYVIKGKSGSGVVCLNGPAARGACPGDQVIIVSYVSLTEKVARKIKPKVVKVNARNQLKD